VYSQDPSIKELQLLFYITSLRTDKRGLASATQPLT